ncbi:MAG: ketoacyl-ACP synthase III [Lachnospiraceae bacterium]|nr:ketoacyl-ACP synthase III [Lachnospiraceae bacterium]
MRMKIVGTGSALPQMEVDNKKLMEWVETSDEWIKERTGIGARRVSTGETVASLAAEACGKALEQAGRSPEEVDLILVATCSPEYLLPCAACQVQTAIGAVNATAFDINAACSGFLFGLTMAHAYMQAGMYKRILIAGSEVLSKIIDWEDRGTCILFGDGAGAVLVEATEDGTSGMISCVQGSDGAKGMVLSCRERFGKNPLYTEDVAEGENLYVQMDGQAVYRFATRQVASCIEDALKKAELSVDDIDLFVLHQANARIIEAVAKRLHADIEKFPMNLDRLGNMSSATIPVLLDELNRAGKLQRGQKIVLSGFGAGLTFGACILTW